MQRLAVGTEVLVGGKSKILVAVALENLVETLRVWFVHLGLVRLN